MANKTPEELQAEFLADWNAAKAERDAALELAWATPDVDERIVAVQAAREAWADRKAELLERQAQLPAI